MIKETSHPLYQCNLTVNQTHKSSGGATWESLDGLDYGLSSIQSLANRPPFKLTAKASISAIFHTCFNRRHLEAENID
jgi:hypothetical protein